MNYDNAGVFCPVIKNTCRSECGLWVAVEKSKKNIGSCLGIRALKLLTTQTVFYDAKVFNKEDIGKFIEKSQQQPGSLLKVDDLEKVNKKEKKKGQKK